LRDGGADDEGCRVEGKTAVREERRELVISERTERPIQNDHDYG
jgi:hypothetical protein